MMLWFKTNRILNVYVIVISFVSCLYFIVHGLSNIKPSIGINSLFLYKNYSQFILILSPALFLFFQKSIANIKFFERKDIIYFLIPALFYWDLGSQFFLNNRAQNKIVFVLLLLHTLFYLIKSYSIIKKYSRNENVNKKKEHVIVYDWLSFIFVISVLVFAHFCISEVLHLWLEKDYILNFAFEICFLILFLAIYFKINFTPELLYGSSYIRKVSDNNSLSKLNFSKVWKSDINKDLLNEKDTLIFNKIEDKITSYIVDIEQFSLQNDAFRDSSFSILNLSRETGLPQYFIYFIFKYYCKIKFNEYKRLVRIFHAVKLINDGFLNSNTLDALAKTVGFSSYNPFLVNFKEITGVSPFDYNKNRIIHKSTYLS